MCSMCEENGEEMIGCPDCGRLICFDVPSGGFDDVVQQAGVTESGDVLCMRCLRRVEAELEEYRERESMLMGWCDPIDEMFGEMY